MLKVQKIHKNIQKLIWGVAALLTLAGLSYNASAAPQMLGLLASAKPIPLTCKDGVSVLLS